MNNKIANRNKKYFLVNSFDKEEHPAIVLDKTTFTGAIGFELSDLEFDFYKKCAHKLCQLESEIIEDEDGELLVAPPSIRLSWFTSRKEYPFLRVVDADNMPEFLLSEKDLIKLLKQPAGFIEISKEDFETLPMPSNIDVDIEIGDTYMAITASGDDDREYHSSLIYLEHLQALHFIIN